MDKILDWMLGDTSSAQAFRYVTKGMFCMLCIVGCVFSQYFLGCNYWDQLDFFREK